MWEQVYTVNHAQSFSSFTIEHSFNDVYLIIKAVCPSAKTDWRRAGYCSPLFNIDNVGLVYGKSEPIRLGIQLIYFANPTQQNFKLNFFLHPWLPNINLSFYTRSG